MIRTRTILPKMATAHLMAIQRDKCKGSSHGTLTRGCHRKATVSKRSDTTRGSWKRVQGKQIVRESAPRAVTAVQLVHWLHEAKPGSSPDRGKAAQQQAMVERARKLGFGPAY